MKTFILDIIPKLLRFSKKLDELALLTNQHWVIVNEIENSKIVYIFRSNFELLISQNGKVEKGKWEYLGNNSLLIEKANDCFLFKHGFFDENILALKIDGKEEYAILVNETRCGSEINTIQKVVEFLENKYLKMLSNNFIQINVNNVIEQSSISYDKEINWVKGDNGKYGYVDKNGILLIDYKFDNAYDFFENRAIVYNTIKGIDFYGVINEKGEIIVDMKFEYADNYSESLALVRLNRKFGFIELLGNVKIPIIYDNASKFQNGKSNVKLNNQQFYIDKDGEKI